MKRIGILAAIVCAIAGYSGGAAAQTPPNYCLATAPCVFTTVDSVTVTANKLSVMGILEGEALPTERYVLVSTSTSSWDSLAACQRLALLAMERPGKYLLRIALPASAYTSATCGLTRVSP